MTIVRLHITAEGQTEQSFVKEVLAPRLWAYSIYADARCVLTGKDNKAHAESRGGMKNYSKAKADIRTWMKEDGSAECRFSTMFDLYALPNDFPCFEEAKRQVNPYKRISMLEKAFAEDIGDRRFIPYIQLHEFEALILADPRRLDWEYLEHKAAINALVKMMVNKNPEEINDKPQTCPSRRILKEIRTYDKVTAGVSVAGKIGLETLRKKCRHFGEWLEKLEDLAPEIKDV